MIRRSTVRERPRLGKYELISRLAAGGMAELFVARAQAIYGFEKVVVLKRIIPAFAADQDFVRMFLREARLAATLQHPNIAQVYDVGEDDGVLFFAMEYVLGQDLRRIVRAVRARESWLTLEHILQIIIGTAAALHYAHEREDSAGRHLGIVHRDVSPSNIMVTYDGGVKLVDFGIARVSSSGDTTSTGVLKGKIPYMSPEQCRGEKLDRRSDVFSLGVILWELACCRRLFVGENDLALAQRIASEDAPPPSSILPNFSPALEAIIMRALARDREQRYATAQELREELEEFARERRLGLSSVSLGRVMSELFAEPLAQQRAAIAAAVAGEPMAFPTLDASTTMTPPISAVETSPGGSEDPASASQRAAPRPTRRRLWLGVGLTVALAGGSAAVWALWGAARSAPASGAAPSGRATMGAASPASASVVEVASVGAPEEAPAESAAEALVEAAAEPVEAEAEALGPRSAAAKRPSRRRSPAPRTDPGSAPGAAPKSGRRGVDGELKDPFAPK
ncbi:MAG: serine/threonine protein kinase [Nannocystis sp.]|nr:serine/threonine protein kinase [Nannocystis sp.]